MPHIVVEATSSISSRIEWPRVFAHMHLEIASEGYAQLNNLKSRIFRVDEGVSGTQPSAQQVVATLIMTNARSGEEKAAMTRIIQQHLCDAIERAAPSEWVQCCVFQRVTPRAEYLHRGWNAPSST